MAEEIERKFLVVGEYKQFANKKYRIAQGYLSSVPERTVRVRIKDDKGYLTIKGVSNATGMSRYEWENEITIAEANDLLKLCEPGIIDKFRYEIEHGNFIFEVDEFLGENLGLTIAEIELRSESDFFTLPTWLGKEVTGNEAYYNSQLSKHPYNTWHVKP